MSSPPIIQSSTLETLLRRLIVTTSILLCPCELFPLWGAEKSSADQVMRTRLSKQRSKYIQRVLVETAKLAPRQDHDLALVPRRSVKETRDPGPTD